MNKTLVQGRSYTITLTERSNGLTIVITKAKLYSVTINDRNVPEMVFHYGECRGTPQSIKLLPGHIEAVAEETPEKE